MRTLLIHATAVMACLLTPIAAAEPEAGFVPLFDGKSLDGWKANETQDAFSVENGAIRAFGPR